MFCRRVTTRRMGFTANALVCCEPHAGVMVSANATTKHRAADIMAEKVSG